MNKTSVYINYIIIHALIILKTHVLVPYLSCRDANKGAPQNKTKNIRNDHKTTKQ